MVQYKLVYFPLRARGEFIRFMFHQAGQEFQDQQVPMAEWSKLKPTMPFAQLPVLYIDGKELSQSMVIGSFLGTKLGLSGSNEWEAPRCQMLSQGISDFITDHRDYIFARVREQNLEKANAIWETLKPVELPTFFEKYDKVLRESNSGWFVGNQVTWADLCIGEFNARVEELIDPTALEKFPNLREHYKRVHELPNIKKYVETRQPKTVPI